MTSEIIEQINDKKEAIREGDPIHRALSQEFLNGCTEMLAFVEQEIDKIYEKNKDNERDALNEMPNKVAIRLQSGFLLGYANATVKFRKELKQKLSEMKEALQ